MTLAIGFRDRILPGDSSLIRDLGGPIVQQFRVLPVLITKLPRVAAVHLRRHPRVEYVSIGRPPQRPFVREVMTWGFAAHEANYAHAQGYTGQGVVIAIIDTGVNCSLAEFQCVTGLSLIPGKSPYQDDNGHGTAVASIAAAKANGSGMKGIAPGASIMPIKVADANGWLPDQCLTLPAAIDFALSHGADVINISGATARWDEPGWASDCWHEAQAMNWAHSSAVVAVAAGNTVQDGDSVAYPARWNYAGMAATGGDCGANPGDRR